MAKNRKKRSKPRSAANQPVTVHRYNAEVEEKKAARRKLKLRSIAASIAAAILMLLGFLLF